MNILKRWWYLTFHRKRCFQLIFSDDWFSYGDMVTNGTTKMMCLEKTWYLILKSNEPFK